MADRGFDIESDMPNGVFINIPPFLDGQCLINVYSIISTVQNLLITILVTNILNKNSLALAQFYARSHCQNGFSQHVNQYL